MNGDRIDTSVSRLDAESLALLELSLVRDVSDEDLGALINAHPVDLRERRKRLFERMGASTPLARAAVVRALRVRVEAQTEGTQQLL